MADISDVVRQRADALMLSGESAVGAYPDKAVNVLRQVATRIEEWVRCVPLLWALSKGSAHDVHHACSTSYLAPSLRLPGESAYNEHLHVAHRVGAQASKYLLAHAHPQQHGTILGRFTDVHASMRRQEKHGQIVLPQLANLPDGRVSEELCASAATMANNLGARAIFVYTRRGYMASFLSRCRPDCPVFAFTGAPRACEHSVAWPVSCGRIHKCACAHDLIAPLHGLSSLVVDLYTSRTWAMVLCDIAEEGSARYCQKASSTVIGCETDKDTLLLWKALRLTQCLFPAQTSRTCGSG